MKPWFITAFCMLRLFVYGQENRILTKDEILSYAVVEQVPIAPGCENLKNKDPEEVKACFQKYVMNHVSGNFTFPEDARQLGVSGKIYVNFVIEKKGTVRHVEIVRGVGDAYKYAPREKRLAARLLDKEAIRVVEDLHFIAPAHQRGKPVRMSFTLPINAKLE